MLRVTNDLLVATGGDSSSFLATIDLTAAFDTINHSTLIARLEEVFGISGGALLAHPLLIIQLCPLFKRIDVHCYVPTSLGYEIIISILKNKVGIVNGLGNYQDIRLIPVISKLLKLVILVISVNLAYKLVIGGLDLRKVMVVILQLLCLQSSVKHFTSRCVSAFMIGVYVGVMMNAEC